MKIKQPILVSIIVFGMLCLLNLTAFADEEADRAALRLIRTNYMEAVNSGDLSKLAPYVGQDATGVMVTGEEVKGFEGVQAYWKKIQELIGPGGSYHVTVNVDKTDLFGDLAVSRGNTDDLIHLSNGKELRFNSYWTAVCRREAGAWKVVRMQATMNPVNNVFTSLFLQKARLFFGGGGIIVGAILAMVIQAFRRRKA